MNFRKIAEEAGVSIATVSRVYNGQKGVGEKTREKIEEILKKNNYFINKEKEDSKSSSDSKMITAVLYETGISVVERNEDYFAGILMGAERTANEFGYMLGFAKVKAEEFEEFITSSKRLKLSKGILLFATEIKKERYHLLEKCPVPLVALDNDVKGISCNCVCPDNVYGTHMAIEYLKSLGHEKIGLLASYYPMGGLPAREQGYYEAMKELGLPVDKEYVIRLDHVLESGIKQMDEHLKKHTNLPTAFFAVNDAIGVAAMHALEMHGYRVPEDISIMGFDDSNVGNSAQPRLSTMQIDRGSLGEMAITRLDQLIHGDDKYMRLYLETPLLKKESTIRIK